MSEFLLINNIYNMPLMGYVQIFSHWLLNLFLGYYLITNLQWYSYKIKRVIFNHHKKWWHFFFFLVPLLAYYLTGIFFWIFFYFTFIPFFYNWFRKLDKKLIFTARVRRFFVYLIALSIFGDALMLNDYTHTGEMELPLMPTLMPLILAVFGMNLNERLLFLRYKKQAQRKIASMEGLQIIQITASFGKTSIKNFIYELLKKEFRTEMTPKSVNTLMGIVKHINGELSRDCEIYIVESGARQKNDILEIAELVEPQYVVLGKIGEQHIEYFKTFENIRATKMEILRSRRLKRAFINSANALELSLIHSHFHPQNPNPDITYYPNNLTILSTSLEGTTFSLSIGNDETSDYTTQLLGSFNPENIAVAIAIAQFFGVADEKIKQSVKRLEFIPHRLEKIENMGKIILDDSFNSNLDGMLEAIELVKSHRGKKMIITCGLVESTPEMNATIAKAIDEVFDAVVITSRLNIDILETHIKKPQKFVITDKAKLPDFLASYTGSGDIILFANDAPNYI